MQRPASLCIVERIMLHCRLFVKLCTWDRERMRLRVFFAALGLVTIPVALVTLPAFAVHGGDTQVSIGSPTGPFSQKKQNEPTTRT
jgi:hypothetical protein